MALDRSIVGRELPAETLLVTRSRLRAFARATGQSDPLYTDVDVAKHALTGGEYAERRAQKSQRRPARQSQDRHNGPVSAATPICRECSASRSSWRSTPMWRSCR